MVDLDKVRGSVGEVNVGRGLSSVYQMMAAGIALAGAAAFYAAQTPALMAFAKSSLGAFLIIGGQLVLIFCIGKIIAKWGAHAGALAFYAIAITMGLAFAPLVHAYTGASLARAFAISCAVLFVASAYGYSTKRSLASLGGLMFVGLIGLIIVGMANIFFQSSWLQVALDAAAVIVFTGLAAWDTQRIRSELEAATEGDVARIVVFGALSMWLNFVNLFSAFTGLTGERD
jgi:FtsH-binding integral membrane protein